MQKTNEGWWFRSGRRRRFHGVSSSASITPITSTTTTTTPNAKLIHDVKQAGRLLREGALVAFPTETVYGLGADALNTTAVTRVFTVKGRPATDPLIVHIHDPRAIDQLVSLPGGKPQEELISRLTQAFWPGPMTLVLPASTIIPPAITAGTGWVGIRCPNHPLALRLLLEAGVPVAAPSANR